MQDKNKRQTLLLGVLIIVISLINTTQFHSLKQIRKYLTCEIWETQTEAHGLTVSQVNPHY